MNKMENKKGLSNSSLFLLNNFKKVSHMFYGYFIHGSNSSGCRDNSTYLSLQKVINREKTIVQYLFQLQFRRWSSESILITIGAWRISLEKTDIGMFNHMKSGVPIHCLIWSLTPCLTPSLSLSLSLSLVLPPPLSLSFSLSLYERLPVCAVCIWISLWVLLHIHYCYIFYLFCNTCMYVLFIKYIYIFNVKNKSDWYA